MNKKKGIIIGAFALIITMVVEYALFGKSIEIKGTATASGNFDLEYECVEVRDGNGNPTDLGTCEIVNNKITTTSTLKKPIDAVEHIITITNRGTIPAVLKTIGSSNNYDEEKVAQGEWVSGDSIYVDRTTLLGATYVIDLDDGSSYYSDSVVEKARIIIQPGKSMRITIDHGWIDSENVGVVQPALPEGGATINYDITLGFEQITN